ncbi:MAG: hypothetical protein AAGE93_17890 [Bacteroidota bacterium]
MKKHLFFSTVFLLVGLTACREEANQEFLAQDSPTDIPLNREALADIDAALVNTNPGFENDLADWSVYEAPSIKDDAIVRIEETGQVAAGSKHLFMRLPASATDNQSQYIHIGQT